jgi:hypothetical protein
MNIYIVTINEQPIMSFQHLGSANDALVEIETVPFSDLRILLTEHAHADGRELLGMNDRVDVRIANEGERSRHASAAQEMVEVELSEGDADFTVHDVVFFLTPVRADNDDDDHDDLAFLDWPDSEHVTLH